MPRALPATPRYVPRSSTNALKDIVEEHYEVLLRDYDERFRSSYGPLHPRLKDLFEAFIRCGDPHFGFLRLKCCNPKCDEKSERIVPLSCKNRGLCPSCGHKRAILWAERMVEEVLPDVPYVQLVFTIPKMLRKAFLFDRSLYGDLCRAAYEATRKFFAAQFPALEKPVAAMVVAPQSFGSLLNHHPHCHALTSLGVFTRDGVFHAAPDDLDFAPLEDLFREEVFRFLLKKERITEERIQLLKSWRHSGFNVNSDRRVPQGDRPELERLLQYMERPPVSLKRLEYRADGRILYRGNFNPSLGRDYQFCSPVEFLAMLVPHIALRHECRIHSYGAISTTIRRQLGWVKKDEGGDGPGEVVVLEDEESDFVKLRRRNWARLIAKVYLDNPALCCGCGQHMKVISALTSPHQDDVIERILQSRGHNTSDPLVRICYPFHPLAGMRFRPDRTLPGPPPVHVLQLSERRLAIPVWMTEDWASAVCLADLPSISVTQLLELSRLVEKALLDLASPSCILVGESVTEEDREDGQTDSADFRARSAPGRDHASTGGQKGSRRRHGEAASSASQCRGRKGGRR